MTLLHMLRAGSLWERWAKCKQYARKTTLFLLSKYNNATHIGAYSQHVVLASTVHMITSLNDIVHFANCAASDLNIDQFHIVYVALSVSFPSNKIK